MATATELYGLLERQGFCCAGTGLPLKSNCELDHIIPLDDGGTSSIENLQWMNKEINRMKGTMSMKRFVAICRRVARHHSK